MSKSSRRQSQSNGTEAAAKACKEFDLEEIEDFIEKIQIKWKIKDKFIDSVTKLGHEPQHDQVEKMNRSIVEGELGEGFLKEDKHSMCLLDIQTWDRGENQAMAEELGNALKSESVKESGGNPEEVPYEDDNSWVIQIFCYETFKSHSVKQALACILLNRMMNHFLTKTATKGKKLHQFVVEYIKSEDADRQDYQLAWRILEKFSEQILNRFPEITLNFVISGITPCFPDLRRLSEFVIGMGLLINGTCQGKNRGRMKCIFCGCYFLKSEAPYPGIRIDGKPFLKWVTDTAKIHDNRGLDWKIRRIMNGILALMWLDQLEGFTEIPLKITDR